MIELLTKIIDIIFLSSLKNYFKKFFAYLKNGWKSYTASAIIIIIVLAFFYVGINIAINYKPVKLAYLNRYFNQTAVVQKITSMMEQLVKACGQGTTVAWIQLSLKDLSSHEKDLTFNVVRGCDYRLAEDCVIDSIRRNPGFYEVVYNLAEDDGRLIEDDTLILGAAIFDFTELKTIRIPIYTNNSVSPEIISLRYKAPKLHFVLSRNPAAIKGIKLLFAAKARDTTRYNEFVTHMVTVTRWGENHSKGCNNKGLEQATSVLIRVIKDSILLF